MALSFPHSLFFINWSPNPENVRRSEEHEEYNVGHVPRVLPYACEMSCRKAQGAVCIFFGFTLIILKVIISSKFLCFYYSFNGVAADPSFNTTSFDTPQATAGHNTCFPEEKPPIK
jgi:hypothetical protein